MRRSMAASCDLSGFIDQPVGWFVDAIDDVDQMIDQPVAVFDGALVTLPQLHCDQLMQPSGLAQLVIGDARYRAVHAASLRTKVAATISSPSRGETPMAPSAATD